MLTRSTTQHRPVISAFTLVELLLSMAILSLLTLVIFEMMKHTQDSVTHQQSRSEEFREARASIETMTRNISGAMMSSYWAYGDYNIANQVRYTRQSDNHFVSGPSAIVVGGGSEVFHGQSIFFQTADGTAPYGSEFDSIVGAPYNLVTCVGYYIDYGSDLEFRPDFIQSNSIANPERKRFRLMEFRLPAEKNILYAPAPTLGLNTQTSRDLAYRWFRGPYAGTGNQAMKDYSIPLADNILALILQPRYISVSVVKGNESSSTQKENSVTTTKPSLNYYYDSREKQWTSSNDEKAVASHHQLPPVVQMTLFAAEERSYESAELKMGETALYDSISEIFAGKFTDYTKYEADMLAVSTALTELGVKHRSFTTNITLRGSKWIVEEQITP